MDTKGTEFLPRTQILFYLLIFSTRCRRPWIFQTLNSVRSNKLGLKYQIFTPFNYTLINIFVNILFV